MQKANYKSCGEISRLSSCLKYLSLSAIRCDRKSGADRSRRVGWFKEKHFGLTLVGYKSLNSTLGKLSHLALLGFSTRSNMSQYQDSSNFYKRSLLSFERLGHSSGMLPPIRW
eukprot:493159_1